jgi:hypothetical protein
MKVEDIKIDAKVIFKDKEEVTIKTLPDDRNRVCIQNEDGGYRLVHISTLGPHMSERFHAWWNHNTFTIRKTDADGNLSFMTIPRDILYALRRVAFSKKVRVRDSMKPKDAVEGTYEKDEK